MPDDLCYNRVLKITTDYLGSPAKGFICRQISSHLKKDPAKLQKQDIPMLAIRIRSGLLVLSHDERAVEKVFQLISAVADT